jgi:hypothetical protein
MVCAHRSSMLATMPMSVSVSVRPRGIGSRANGVLPVVHASAAPGRERSVSCGTAGGLIHQFQCRPLWSDAEERGRCLGRR